MRRCSGSTIPSKLFEVLATDLEGRRVPVSHTLVFPATKHLRSFRAVSGCRIRQQCQRETGNLGPCVSVTSALILIVHVSIQQLGISTLCRMIHCLLCSVCIHECQDPVQTTPHRTHTRALFLAAHARTPDVITRLAQGLTMCVPQKSFHHWSCLC